MEKLQSEFRRHFYYMFGGFFIGQASLFLRISCRFERVESIAQIKFEIRLKRLQKKSIL